ncbi:Flagellar hook-associated protein 2 C-terminus [Selenomonas ruminantium]|uniref:Flagellar hook-associated protein 2 C-terminus n=1 Tax=Selenomonas ruminantium TaxID=971 RepID=A0A1M6SR08_SELRU|nr:flagellar filament capping protein FliD [Selenomonas ruminantium]SHK47184.1 Flagellar hook-associated protein 2 C-terminus [Selenomonas ruminantium]
MSTISAMTKDTYTMYKMAQGDTQKTTAAQKASAAEESSSQSSSSAQSKSYTAAASNISSLSTLVDSFNSAYSSKKSNASQDSIASLWSGYTNSTASSLASMSAISGVSSSAAGLVNSYNEAKSNFDTQFKAYMGDLHESAQTAKNMSYEFSADDIKEAEDGTKTYSDGLKKAISNVKQLVSDYNDSLDLTSDYSSVGKRMESLHKSFADTTYRADTYKQLGITVDSKTGKMSVDEDKLAKALTENGDRVKNALGSNGLAGKAEQHLTEANNQSDKLFPSLQSMFGDSIKTASAYTNPRVLSASVQYGMIGNLFSSLF